MRHGVQRTKHESLMTDASTGVTPIAVAVVEHEGAVLVGRRDSDSPLAGLWEFPGGKVESTESPASAAVRECWEETGLKVEVVAPFSERIEQYEHDRLRLHFFRCRPLRPRAVIRAPFRWVSVSELAALTFPAGNRDVLKRLSARRS